jgi:hypothetical protein
MSAITIKIMQEITNMLVDLAGNQILPQEAKITDEIKDQSKDLQIIESNINEYIKNYPNFAKSIHDKIKKQEILIGIINIIDTFDFEIKDSYKKLWEAYILNVISDEEKILHLNKVKTSIVNKKILTYIDSEIRTYSKITNIIKKILSSPVLFVQDEDSLSQADKIKKENIDKTNKKNYDSVIHFLDRISFSGDKNLIVNQFFNCVRLVDDDKIKCEFYNKFLVMIIIEIIRDPINKTTNNNKSLTAAQNKNIKDIKLMMTDIENIQKIKKNAIDEENEKLKTKSDLDIYNKSKSVIKNYLNIKSFINNTNIEYQENIETILFQVYLYLINNEEVKNVDTEVLQYINEKNFEWFTYQITKMSYKLYPHWNFNTKKFILDVWQKHCIQNIYQKMVILLSLPTSAGKTIISTSAIRKFRKIWYIVPTEPLALQLTGIIISSLIEIEKRAGESKRNITLAIKSLYYKRFMGNDDIIIATPEQLFNLITEKKINKDIDYVIIDEFHNIVNDGIGKYIEGILLFAAFHQIPTICLSATIPNFDEVKIMLENRFNLPVFGVSEKKRFFNQERFMIKNLNLVKIDPLNHISINTLRSKEFTHIGLPPTDVNNLYKKLSDVPRIDENDRKFLTLDNVHKLECDMFSYLKTQSDEVLSQVVASNPIIDEQLSMYELFLMLKKFNTADIKPMIIFTMNSEKCMDRFNKLLIMVREYESLIYERYMGDQEIIREYFSACDEKCDKIKEPKESNKKDKSKFNKRDSGYGNSDGINNTDDDSRSPSGGVDEDGEKKQNLEEKKEEIKTNLFEGNPGTKFKPKEYYLINGFAKNDDDRFKMISKWLINIGVINENDDILDSISYENYNEFIKSQDKLSQDEINEYLKEKKIQVPTDYDGDDESKKFVKPKSETGTVFELIKFYIEFVNRNIEQKFIDDFNNKYGASLTAIYIKKLRNIHSVREFRKYSNKNGLHFRNEHAPHPECRLIDNDIPPEEMRKIKRRINNELKREILIQNQIKEDLKIYESTSLDSVTSEPEVDVEIDVDIEGKIPEILKNNKVEKEETNLISYDHPFMRGLEFGILCYNKIMNPALQRVSQYLINKHPFITFSDESLAVGINYPIKTVMILGGLKNEPLEMIDNALAHQAIGRAGRRGLDIKSVVIYSGVIIEDILIQKYKHINPNNIEMITSMFESQDMKDYIVNNIRPDPSLIVTPSNVTSNITQKPIISVTSQNTISENNSFDSKTDILSPDYEAPDSWMDCI